MNAAPSGSSRSAHTELCALSGKNPREPARLLTAVFVVALVATGLYYLHLMRGRVVVGDDILIARRGYGLSAYLEPYISNLDAIPIAIYHLIYRVFGFASYTPLAVVFVSSQLAVALATFLVVRSRVGASLALVAGMALLWYPTTDLYVAEFQHFFAMAAVIMCSWALRKADTKFDVLIAVALAFALFSTGAGIAGAAGCVTYLALSHGSRRRWYAVGIPVGLYFLWTLTYNDGFGTRGDSVGDILRYTYDGIMATFRGLAFDNRLLGVVLAAAFIANIAFRLSRNGVRASRHEVAWTVALVTWFVGLALYRGALANVPGPIGFALSNPEQFRYQFVGAAFVVLASLPDRRSPTVIGWTSRPWPIVVALATAALFVAVNRGDISAHADFEREAARSQREAMIAAHLGPSVIPDDTELPVILDGITAGQYRAIVDRYGAPDGTRPDHPDAAIVALTRIGLEPVTPPPGECFPVEGTLGVAPGGKPILRAGASPVTVELRRFEGDWTTIGTIAPQTAAVLALPYQPGLPSWEVSSPGACRIFG